MFIARAARRELRGASSECKTRLTPRKFPAHCPLPTAHCLLPTAYCLLPTANPTRASPQRAAQTAQRGRQPEEDKPMHTTTKELVARSGRPPCAHSPPASVLRCTPRTGELCRQKCTFATLVDATKVASDISPRVKRSRSALETYSSAASSQHSAVSKRDERKEDQMHRLAATRSLSADAAERAAFIPTRTSRPATRASTLNNNSPRYPPPRLPRSPCRGSSRSPPRAVGLWS
jgi:hypothetical protein